jgi:hypothetical protein
MMEHIGAILGGGFGIALIGILLARLYRHSLEKTTSAASIFLLVVVLPLAAVAGVFLYIASLERGGQIARGERPDILPFRAHPDKHLAQAQRTWSNECRLHLLPSKIDEDRWLEYYFEIPIRESARMLTGDSGQFYWCFDSVNPEYRGCYFRNQYFPASLELDREFERLVENARNRCEIRKHTREEVSGWPKMPLIIERGPEGSVTEEELWRFVDHPAFEKPAGYAAGRMLLAWCAQVQAEMYIEELRGEFREKFR